MKTIIITAILLFTTIGFGQSTKKQCRTLYQQLEVKLDEEKVLREEYYSLYSIVSNGWFFGIDKDSAFMQMQAVKMKLIRLENVYAKLLELKSASILVNRTSSNNELNKQSLDSMNTHGYQFNRFLAELNLPILKLELIGDRSQKEYLSYLKDFDQSLQLIIKKEQAWIENCKLNQQYMRYTLVVFESLKPQYLALIKELEEMDVERLLEQERLNYQQNGPNGFSEKYAFVFPDIFDRFSTMQPKPKYEVQEEPVIYEVVDKDAEFPGGRDAMNEFLKTNIKVPSKITESGLSGKVVLKFVVSSSGNISNVRIQKGLTDCVECDKEAIRVVRMMPNWTPGSLNGKLVNQWFTLPIKF